jgi:succinate dehydrogenase hydrophobic anchor subunit
MMDINLLPPQSVQQRYAFSIQVVSAAALSILTVVFVILAVTEQSRAASDEATAEHVQSLVSQAKKQVASLQKQVQSTGVVSSIHYESGLGVDVRDFVKSIVGKAPQSAAFTSIHADDSGQITLVGIVGSASDLAKYEESLRQLNRISSVWVQSTTTDQKVHFTMTLHLQNGGGTQ